MKHNEIPVKARALLDDMLHNQFATTWQMFDTARRAADDFDCYRCACLLVELYHLALMHGFSTMTMQHAYKDACGFLAAHAERLANHAK